jgi:hypothetical protein
MTTKRVVKVPVVVFERAKAAASTGTKKAPAPPPRPTAPGRKRSPLAREKVVAALKKLHPMD